MSWGAGAGPSGILSQRLVYFEIRSPKITRVKLIIQFLRVSRVGISLIQAVAELGQTQVKLEVIDDVIVEVRR